MPPEANTTMNCKVWPRKERPERADAAKANIRINTQGGKRKKKEEEEKEEKEEEEEEER